MKRKEVQRQEGAPPVPQLPSKASAESVDSRSYEPAQSEYNLKTPYPTPHPDVGSDSTIGVADDGTHTSAANGAYATVNPYRLPTPPPSKYVPQSVNGEVVSGKPNLYEGKRFLVKDADEPPSLAGILDLRNTEDQQVHRNVANGKLNLVSLFPRLLILWDSVEMKKNAPTILPAC